MHGKVSTVFLLERSRPHQVRGLRRLVMLAISWVQRRHSDGLTQLPFSLCKLADTNVCQTQKTAMMNEWDATPACCLRPGLARSLKSRGIRGEDLASQKWQTVLFAFASLATCTVADCERKHADHKRLASRNLSFISLLVNSINNEARTTFIRLQRHAQRLASSKGVIKNSSTGRKRKHTSAFKDPVGLIKSRPDTSKASALWVFRHQYIAAHKSRAGSHHRNWFTSDSWKEVKDAFNDLRPDEQQQFSQIANNMNMVRKFRRRTSKNLDESAVVETETHALSLLDTPPVFSMLITSDSLKDHVQSVQQLMDHLGGCFVQAGQKQCLGPWPVKDSQV